MSLTPNYGFIIPTGSDAVNLLTQCYPNFSSLDTILKPIQESGVTVATDTKVGTVHQLVRTDSSCNMFRFIATGNYASGDTFTVDGASVTATAMDGTALSAGAFVINQSVVCILNNLVLTVLVSGKETTSLPASSVTYDNTGSGLTATNAQDAIDELQTEISNIPTITEHGVIELWKNPDYSLTFGSQSISILTDALIDTFLVEMGNQSGYATILGSAETSSVGDISRLSLLSNGDISQIGRTITPSPTTGGYSVSISDCVVRTRATNGTVTTITDNTQGIPLRLLGIIHNN